MLWDFPVANNTKTWRVRSSSYRKVKKWSIKRRKDIHCIDKIQFVNLYDNFIDQHYITNLERNFACLKFLWNRINGCLWKAIIYYRNSSDAIRCSKFIHLLTSSNARWPFVTILRWFSFEKLCDLFRQYNRDHVTKLLIIIDLIGF